MNEFISTFKIRSQKTRGHLLRNSIYYMQIFFFFFCQGLSFRPKNIYILLEKALLRFFPFITFHIACPKSLTILFLTIVFFKIEKHKTRKFLICFMFCYMRFLSQTQVAKKKILFIYRLTSCWWVRIMLTIDLRHSTLSF